MLFYTNLVLLLQPSVLRLSIVTFNNDAKLSPRWILREFDVSRIRPRLRGIPGVADLSCQRDLIKTRDYMDRRVTSLPGVSHLLVNRPLLLFKRSLIDSTWRQIWRASYWCTCREILRTFEEKHFCLSVVPWIKPLLLIISIQYIPFISTRQSQNDLFVNTTQCSIRFYRCNGTNLWNSFHVSTDVKGINPVSRFRQNIKNCMIDDYNSVINSRRFYDYTILK